jgi:hypothetical protein
MLRMVDWKAEGGAPTQQRRGARTKQLEAGGCRAGCEAFEGWRAEGWRAEGWRAVGWRQWESWQGTRVVGVRAPLRFGVTHLTSFPQTRQFLGFFPAMSTFILL